MKTIFTLLIISTFVACGSDGESNNGQNNGDNNGQNNGSNNGDNNGSNNGSNNGLNNGSNNGSNNGLNNGTIVVPETYNFESQFISGESSIKYSGQTFRHLLISDLSTYIGGLTSDIDTGVFAPSVEGEVLAALDVYFRFDSTTSGAEDFLLTTDPTTMQTTYDDVSSDKNLVGKLAGNDAVTDHKDWSTNFKGWNDDSLIANGGSKSSPEGLMIAMFETLEKQAIDRVNGTTVSAPDGKTAPGGGGATIVLPVHVTASGLDLKQLTQKLLLMGITFSQATDDYLDDDVDGKGLRSPNTQDDDKPYTKLERAWDEGFGYFGAAKDYLSYTDVQIADKDSIDTDADGKIDLLSEKNWGASINAAKRDKGSTSGTDFTKDIMTAFLNGRTLITNAGEELTEGEMTELKGYRDEIVLGWEKAIAATIIHYINENVELIEAFATQDYDLLKHAKVWSELKGFALGLQFNPRSPMQDDFVELHEKLGDLVPHATAGLLEARDLMAAAYGFDSQDVANW